MKLDGRELGEGQEIAMRALLDVAQDQKVRPGMRITAAQTVFFGNDGGGERAYVTDDLEESGEQATEQATEDVYDAIAERVLTRLTPIIESVVARFATGGTDA